MALDLAAHALGLVDVAMVAVAELPAVALAPREERAVARARGRAVVAARRLAHLHLGERAKHALGQRRVALDDGIAARAGALEAPTPLVELAAIRDGRRLVHAARDRADRDARQRTHRPRLHGVLLVAVAEQAERAAAPRVNLGLDDRRRVEVAAGELG